MCGPVMASTIDIIVDSYDLHSIVERSRSTDSIDDSDIVMVDTIAAK